MDRSVFEWLPAEHGDGAKCPARILDTVLLDAGGMPASWLYTSKNGHVCAKKPSGLSWEKMAARFSKFALAHPLNAQGPKLVASAIRHDGAVHDLTERELAALRDDAAAHEHVVRAGAGGADDVFVCGRTPGGGGGGEGAVGARA